MKAEKNEVNNLRAQIKKIQEANGVNNLKAQVKKIQKTCEHDWRLTEKPDLYISCVPGVFVGTREPFGRATEMKLICKKCSKRLVTSIRSICPYCLSPMREGSLYTYEDGKTSREKYFGKDYLYYAIRLDHCTKCSFMVASDEWSQ